MITVSLSTTPLLEQPVECLGVVLEQDFIFDQQLQGIADRFFPALRDMMKKKDFTGKNQSVLVVPIAKENRVVHLIFVGIGSKNKKGIIEIEQFRRALSRLERTAEAHRCTSIAVHLPDAKLFGVSARQLAKETVIAAQMSAYIFDEFITEKERKVRHLKDLILIDVEKDFAKGLQEGLIIADAVNMCRHWIDAPPFKITPLQLADYAQKIAKENNLKVTVFDEQEIIAMGMGGLAGVSAGSDQDCKLVILEYKSPKPNAQTLCLVGKGITFDSGGLSIKPAQSMETMKDDMSGAAAVIATMKVIAQLKPDLNIIGITPLSENLPSGNATKPGDILRFYNGKTAEVKNTDAEGRLILADALSYAVKQYKPDAMIDIATLTGACSYALGPFFSGMMSKHDELAEKVKAAGDRSGDRVWALPFTDDYKVAIKAQVADICNIGSGKYRAGAITAGFFLQHFVDDVPWVHLDIAGTAFDVPDIPYFRPEGATGVGVRLFVDLIMHWNN